MCTTNFSRRGEPVTVFEAQLVAESVIARPERISELWVQIARRIGVDNLALILDEIGGEKVHVPTREEFFAALYRPLRNRQIVDMRHETGRSLREIGKFFNLTHKAVALVLESATDDA